MSLTVWWALQPRPLLVIRTSTVHTTRAVLADVCSKKTAGKRLLFKARSFKEAQIKATNPEFLRESAMQPKLASTGSHQLSDAAPGDGSAASPRLGQAWPRLKASSRKQEKFLDKTLRLTLET